MELMACANLVGGTMVKSCIFTDIIFYYQWYEILPKCLYYIEAARQPFLLLVAANLALAGFLGLKWSLWPVPAWLAVQRSKAVLFLNLYYSINDRNTSIFYAGNTSIFYASHVNCATAIFVVDCCQFGPSRIVGLKMELMACANVVRGTPDKSCLFNGFEW